MSLQRFVPMKQVSQFHRPLVRLKTAAAICSGIIFVGIHTEARATAVDVELVLLVDASTNGTTAAEFSNLLNAYATTFTSSQVLDSIQSGGHGRIAVSLQFYGGATTPQVGIPWMSIGNATEAATFASLVQNLTRPATAGRSLVAPGLNFATQTFGTETGGSSNGFESTLQIIDVVATTVPTNATTTVVRAAGDAAIASGVDVINAVALGGATRTAAIANYFQANVVDSAVVGLPATVSTSVLNRNLLATNVAGIYAANLSASVTAIPEPSVGFGVASTICLILLRRKRP